MTTAGFKRVEFRIKTFGHHDMSQLGILRRQSKTSREYICLGVVRDKVELVVCRGTDGEALLDESVGFVGVDRRALVTPRASSCIQFTVSEETAEDTTW